MRTPSATPTPSNKKFCCDSQVTRRVVNRSSHLGPRCMPRFVVFWVSAEKPVLRGVNGEAREMPPKFRQNYLSQT